MQDATHGCAVSCRRKLKTLLRTARFRMDAESMRLFKNRIVSFIEYRTRTLAIVHASSTVLEAIELVQRSLLQRCSFSAHKALWVLNRAALRASRQLLFCDGSLSGSFLPGHLAAALSRCEVAYVVLVWLPLLPPLCRGGFFSSRPCRR